METLLIKRKDVKSLLTIERCITAVEEAFKLLASGKAQPPGILGVHAKDGGFHIKAGILNLSREYFVAKTNGNFPNNQKNNGLPTIQGVIVVCDATNGKLLAVMDSIEITIIRTGAATAVAAKYLSKPDSKTVTICGCGNQGEISLRAVKCVRNIDKAFAYDIDEKIAMKFASTLTRELGITIEIVSNLNDALSQSDICITCTTSDRHFISKHHVKPGTFIAAVGSDSEHKQELDPKLLAGSKVVADSIEQAIRIGELHHALSSNNMKREDIFGEIGEVVAGIKPGRVSEEEIIIFDSTGIALQDVAAAAVVYENALSRNIGLEFNLADI
jgi:alanine dehydrogenase